MLVGEPGGIRTRGPSAYVISTQLRLVIGGSNAATTVRVAPGDVLHFALQVTSPYRDSRPVRVGNGAWDQVQLDVYGELLSAAWLLADQIGQFGPVTARFLVDVVDTAAARWEQPDRGILEVRGEPRHFVDSKLMCWVALDRAVRLTPMLGAEDRVETWTTIRDEIRVAIQTEGWSERAGAFGQSLGSDKLDAPT